MSVSRRSLPSKIAAVLPFALVAHVRAADAGSAMVEAAAAIAACSEAAERGDQPLASERADAAESALAAAIGPDARVLHAQLLLACRMPFVEMMARGGLAAEAERALRDALADSPEHIGARELLATLLYHLPPFLGRTGDAIAELERLIETREAAGASRPEPYLQLGDLRARQGDPVGARDAWRRGLERHPGSESLRERLIASPPEASTPSAADPPADAASSSLDAALRERVAIDLARPGSVGLSVAVERGGVPLLFDGFGWADLEHGAPATADSIHRLGSITKQFVAVALVELADRGSLSLDDPVCRFLPDLENAEGITLRHLLSHTAGLPLDLPVSDAADWRSAALEPAARVGAPGERYAYSNVGYAIAGEALAAVAGRDAVETLLLGPLGLDAIAWCDERAIVPGRAQGYQLVGTELFNDEPLSGDQRLRWAGGLCGSARDLARWLRALHGGALLGERAYQDLVTPPPVTVGDTTYALGLRAERDPRGRRVVHHSGATHGFLSEAAYFAADDVVVVVLANSEAASPRALGYELAAIAGRGTRTDR